MCGPEEKKPLPLSPSTPVMMSRAPVRVRVPVSRPSPLPPSGAPAYPPGYTGWKPPYKVPGIGSHFLPARGTAARPDSSKARGTDPEGSAVGLGVPEEPNTSQPLHLIHRSPADRWRMLHEPRPREVWADSPLPHSFSSVGHLMPMDQWARERWKDYKLRVRHARVMGKRPVIMTAGPSALQYATAPRLKPGSPSLIVGAGPQEPLRPNAKRGRLAEQDKAPRPILERLAQLAARSGAPR